MGAALSAVSRRLCPPTRTKTLATTPYGNPLPPEVHVTLSSAHGGGLRGDGRIVIVGDVHGCDRELRALLSKVAFQAGRDNLILVGDLVGKGPEPRAVLRTIREHGGLSCRGNYDDAALSAAAAAAANSSAPPPAKHAWVTGGGRDPDLDHLASLPFSMAIPELGVAVVHAGLVPGEPLARQPLKAVYKMRDLRRGANGSSNGWEWLEKGQDGTVAWASLWEGPYHVFFGHDAKRKLQLRTYATGLDTGCVYGGKLTAALLPPPSAPPPAARAAIASGRAPTLEELGGEIVGVDAAAVYDDPSKGKEEKKLLKNKALQEQGGGGGALVEAEAEAAREAAKKEKKKAKKAAKAAAEAAAHEALG